MDCLIYPVTNIPMQSMNEIPDKLAITIELGGCKHKCKGCHSPEMWEGADNNFNTSFLSLEDIMAIVEANIEAGCRAIAVMGGDANIATLLPLLRECSATAPTALYVGQHLNEAEARRYARTGITYLKTGQYVEALGGLDKPQTNQRFYKITPEFYEDHGDITTVYRYDDWTYKFRRDDIT